MFRQPSTDVLVPMYDISDAVTVYNPFSYKNFLSENEGISLVLPRIIKIKLEKLLSFDGIIGYLFLRAIESITKTKSTRDLNDLSEWLEWPLIALKKWVFGIPNGYYYDSFYIPKKGGRGKRRIDAPNQELKVLQQRVYHKLLLDFCSLKIE